MAYFTKEIYDGKREWAAINQDNNIKIIAEKLELSDNEDAVEELKILSDLCTERHNMHSSNESDWECFDVLGNQYSCEETLIDRVNAVNEKYNIIGLSLNCPAIPEISGDDDTEDIADYYDIDIENENELYETLISDWRDVKDKVSEEIRSWFFKINKKYGTNFPD